MGNRKHQMAIKYKEAKKAMTFARLKNSPIPARKMRLVADQLRGERSRRPRQAYGRTPGWKGANSAATCAKWRDSYLYSAI